MNLIKLFGDYFFPTKKTRFKMKILNKQDENNDFLCRGKCAN